MKRGIALALALMLVLSLAACGGNNAPAPSGNDDPGTSQQEPSNTPDNNTPASGAAQKADGEQMEADTEDAIRYEDVISLSGLSSIGKPVGYTLSSTSKADDNTTMRGLRFNPNSGSVADTDIDGYAAAIWNLCIDTADGGAIFNRSGESYTSLSETKNTTAGTYTWYYNFSGTKIKVQLYIESDVLNVEFSK